MEKMVGEQYTLASSVPLIYLSQCTRPARFTNLPSASPAKLQDQARCAYDPLASSPDRRPETRTGTRRLSCDSSIRSRCDEIRLVGDYVPQRLS